MPPKLIALAQSCSPTLAVLIALSITTLAVGLERLVALLYARSRLAHGRAVVLQHLGQDNAAAALQANLHLPAHPAQGLLTALLDRAPVRATQLRREQAQLGRRVRRGLWVLGSVGSVAPFVGLLGTVLGVMEAFAAMGQEGAGGFSVVSRGLSEALVTTAAGIFVAIEAVLLFNYLQIAAGSYAAEVKEALEEVLESQEAAGGAAEKR